MIQAGFFLRERLSPPEVIAGVAAALGLDQTHVRELTIGACSVGEGIDQEGVVVVVEHNQKAVGFGTQLDLYIDEQRVPIGGDQVAVATSLARRFQQDVLTSPGPPLIDAVLHPSWWLLARPTGALYRVMQIIQDDDDGTSVVIDERPARMAPIDTAG